MSGEQSTTESERKGAWEEDECLLCAPGLHENCEAYTTVLVVDPSNIPLGDDYDDHMVSVPVCHAHFEAFKQYQSGKNVAEVSP